MMKRNSGHDVLLGSVLALAVLASFLALAVLLVELSDDADAPTEEFMPNGTARPMSLRYFCLALCRTSTVRSETDPDQYLVPGPTQRDIAANSEMTAMPIRDRGG
ncbi:hypothetical protein [Bradyrhizobium sp. sGM-13]|uniref:hypothetical protein n=1 Tax=Bradyrhizobium sp. sGM-13 TaxID=2831781 RepID=UPI001BCBD786|nr:hypothetical protein [Bradyrhizobium sp. sGM-13]